MRLTKRRADPHPAPPRHARPHPTLNAARWPDHTCALDTSTPYEAKGELGRAARKTAAKTIFTVRASAFIIARLFGRFEPIFSHTPGDVDVDSALYAGARHRRA